MCKPALRRVYGKLSSSAYGGAQLLGIDGICIISHGSSGAEAICNAIHVAVELSDKHVNDRIVQTIRELNREAPKVDPQPATL